MSLFGTIFYKPLFNALILFYQFFPGHDFGIAVILLTILIRLLLYPLGAAAIKSQKVFQDIQPRIREIQKKYKDDKEKQMEATLELYKGAKINPFASFLPLLIQLPILIALFQVFHKGFNPGEISNLYHFIPQPETVKTAFLGIMDLSKPFIFETNNQLIYYWPAFVLAVFCGVLQYFQAKMMTPQIKKEDEIGRFSSILQKQTSYLFPALIVLMLVKIPSAIGLYWLATTIFSIIQQYIILKSYAKPQ